MTKYGSGRTAPHFQDDLGIFESASKINPPIVCSQAMTEFWFAVQ